jgi:hypothetical protein
MSRREGSPDILWLVVLLLVFAAIDFDERIQELEAKGEPRSNVPAIEPE